MKKKQNFFEKQSVTATFAIIALLGGLYFVAPGIGGGVTGNSIYDDVYAFSLTGGVGALLLLCSLILGIHSIRKK